MTPAGDPRTLAGRYRLGEVIGHGGMSTVYRATDLALDRTVAVKVALEPLMERDPVYVARFTREAHAAAALSHPNVVAIYDAGTDGPTRYIVMEYVAGQSLDRILRDQHPLEPARAAQIARQVAYALSAAHAAGIIHRDVKPGNVMIADDGSVKVLDFGIARALHSGTITRTAAVLGTAPYMSPEQALGQPADARSDIYALGCVLYEMLTGQPPFMAEVPAAVMNQHINATAPRPSGLNPRVPPALDALVMQMLEKSPEDRPQTAAEVRDRLDRVLASRAGAGEAAAGAIEPPATAATVPLVSAMPEGVPEREAVPEPVPEPEAAPEPEGVPQPQAVPEPEEVPEPEAIPDADAGEASASEPAPVSATPAPRSTAPTRSLTPGAPPPASTRAWRGVWLLVAMGVALLVGGAVAIALAGGSGRSSSTTGRGSPPVTNSHPSSHSVSTSTPASTSTPTTATSTTTKSTTASKSTSTSTPTSTTTPTSPTPGTVSSTATQPTLSKAGTTTGPAGTP